MKGSQALELAESKDPKDKKKLKKLMEFCQKCEEANYEYGTVQALRQQYAD
jgi:hypothetical protein